jgi:hypothetical protein
MPRYAGWRSRPSRVTVDTVIYPMVEDLAHLTYLVNLNSIELHIPQWRVVDGERQHPDRLEAARSAYRVDAVELALGYRSDANLGRRTRLAMVEDVWAMTLARARGQRPPERGSCCFIYVLPGVHECSGCPRLSSTGAGTT